MVHFQQGIVKVKIIICGIWVFSPTFRRLSNLILRNLGVKP
jgi:hypothetical protein